MGGGTKRESRQTTTQTLPANQQRNVDALLQGALDYFNSGGRQFFPGDTVANFDPLQTQGQNTLVDFAQGPGQDFVSSVLNSNAFFADPNNVLNLDNIPGFRATQDATTGLFTRNLLENILPKIRGGGTSSGQFGGSASGIGQALSVDRSQQALADALARQDLQAYGLGLNSLNQALNRAPSLFALGAAPGQLVSDVGQQRQIQAQNEIRGARERFDFAQNEPAILLSLLQALTGSFGQFGGTTDTNATERTSSSGGLSQALGGALAIASLMSGNPAPLLGALGGAGGGGASGLGGLLANASGNSGAVLSGTQAFGPNPFAGLFPSLQPPRG